MAEDPKSTLRGRQPAAGCKRLIRAACAAALVTLIFIPAPLASATDPISAASTVDALIAELQATRDADRRPAIVRELTAIGEPAVAPLVDLLVTTEDRLIRQAVRPALADIGASAVGTLARALDATQDDQARRSIATTLHLIGPPATQALPALARAREATRDENTIRAIEAAIQVIGADRSIASWLLRKISEHPFHAGAVVFGGAWLVSWTLLFLFRPLAFHHAARLAKEMGPIELGPYKIPLPLHIFIVGWLRHHPRVLDAWVNRNRATARERFLSRPTVRERMVHIPMPLELAGKVHSELTPELLRSDAFGRQPGILLIWGEGGSGKTSLACQIARWCLADQPDAWPCGHPMLPVLIEYELDIEVAQGRSALFDAVGHQIENMIGLEYRLDDELIEALLRRRRLLVIVDHFSEMSETTRKRVRPDVPGFPAKALVITSRRREELGGTALTELRPLPVDAERIIDFMSAYLRDRGVRDHFTDSDFIEACNRLKALVGGHAVTVLLVRMFADQLVEAKRAAPVRELPANIPDLMLAYVSRVNQALPQEERRPNSEAQRDAQVVASVCLSAAYQPAESDLATVFEALGEDADARLSYLCDQLKLAELVGVQEDRVRFPLDPLAEYLAALHIVTQHGPDVKAWRRFLNGLAPHADGARDFVFALWDCIRARPTSATPRFVLSELESLIAKGARPREPAAIA